MDNSICFMDQTLSCIVLKNMSIVCIQYILFEPGFSHHFGNGTTIPQSLHL